MVWRASGLGTASRQPGPPEHSQKQVFADPKMLHLPYLLGRCEKVFSCGECFMMVVTADLIRLVLH